MLSLAIIAAIMLMATRYFIIANQNMKVSQATEIASTLINSSFKWVEGQPDFSDFNTTTGGGVNKLVKDGILPQSWNGKEDPWGKTITLTGFTSPGSKPDNQQIKITLPGAPDASADRIDDILSQQGVVRDDCGNGYCGYYPATTT